MAQDILADCDVTLAWREKQWRSCLFRDGICYISLLEYISIHLCPEKFLLLYYPSQGRSVLFITRQRVIITSGGSSLYSSRHRKPQRHIVLL